LFFKKLLFKFFYICFPLEKLVNKKYFPVKEKFNLVSRKVLPFYFERKTFSRNCEKFRNIILFTNHIKFGHQTFDCYIYIYIYIYILFWIFIFQFHPLEFNFYINFGCYIYIISDLATRAMYFIMFNIIIMIFLFYQTIIKINTHIKMIE